MSSSGGAPNVNASSRPAVIAGQGRSPDAPSPCARCDHAPSDPSAAATPVAPDLDGLRAAAAVANALLEAYQDLLDKHQQAMRDLIAAHHHNEELHARGRPNWEIVRAFVDFAQHRYDVSQGRLRQAIQHEADAVQENEKLRIELQGFGDLRARHALAEEVASEAYTRLHDYAMGLEQRLASSPDPQSTDPAVRSSLLAQDLRDLREENALLKKRSADLERSLQTADSSLDVALRDLFQLQKDHADLRRHYEQWKVYGEGLDQEARRLHKRLDESVPAADLHASQIEVHVRGQRIIELERLLSKSDSRREKLHRAHDRVVARLKAADQETTSLKRQLSSAFRQHAHAEDVLQGVEDQLRASKSDHTKLSKAIDAVDEELKVARSQLEEANDDLRAIRKAYDELDEDRELTMTDRRQLRISLKQAKAEIANFGPIRQDRDTAVAQVDQLKTERARVCDDRDRAIQYRDHATQDRDEIVLESRILSQIADMQRAYQFVRRDHDQLQDRHSRLQKEHQDLSADHTSVISERDDALDSLASLASAALRGASTMRRERSSSVTRRSSKRSRSLSPVSRQPDPSRPQKIPRSSSPASPAALGSDADKAGDSIPPRPDPFADLPADDEDDDYPSESGEVGSDAGSDDLDPTSDQADQPRNSPSGSATVPDLAGSDTARNDAKSGVVRGSVSKDPAKSTASSGSDVTLNRSASESDDSEDDQVRVALARSRADARRRRSSGNVSASGGSSAAPIELDQETAPDEPGDDAVEPEITQDETGADANGPETADPAVPKRPGSVFQPYGPVESFVPGLHQARRVAESDAIPWDPEQISALTLDTVTPRILIERKVLPVGWLFQKRTGRMGQLDRALYAPGLITEANAGALYDGKPWEDLDLSPVRPSTFDPTGFPHLATIASNFQIFLGDHCQAIWEATHSFPISKARQKAEAWAATFYSGRKNQSSHAREKLRAWEDQALAKIRQTGCCDLDILFYPAFLRFPQLSEDTTWFPGREAVAEGRAPPQDLKTALTDCDRSAPWRNHYRTDPGAHPLHKVDRLRLRFFSADPDQE